MISSRLLLSFVLVTSAGAIALHAQVPEKKIEQKETEKKELEQKEQDQKKLEQEKLGQEKLEAAKAAEQQKAAEAQKAKEKQPSLEQTYEKPAVPIITPQKAPVLKPGSSITKIDPSVLLGTGDNWDFELGTLRDWHCEGTPNGDCAGTAFANQPTFGDNVAARIPGVSANPHGNYWIGTYEDRRTPRVNEGSVQGDGPTGILVSRRFRIRTPSIRFRVGGGSSARGVRVQLVTTEDVEEGGLLLEAAGQDDEVMRTVTWDVRRFDGMECVIRIVDRGSGGWGHINADDFEFDSAAPVPETFRGWDFENLEDAHRTWTFEGTAFERQPTFGDNVTSSRLGTPAVQLARSALGGNYWDTPFPIGHQGNNWVGTYENRATPGDLWGGTRGDGPTGTMTSVEFQLNHPYLSFLIGGGADPDSERVELVVRRDGEESIVRQASGQNSELLRRQTWDVSSFRGATAFLRVIDAASGGWGHINVDDFRFTDAPPEAAAQPVWGFADTHAHPMAHLGFGGQLYWGSPEGPYETALPACEPAHGIHGTGLRDVGGFANILGAVIPELLTLGAEEVGRWAEDQANQWATSRPLPARTPEEQEQRLMRAVFNIVRAVDPDVLLQLGVIAVERRTGHRTHGWPEMDGWPRFDSPMHQHMHEEWIRRAYQGGLRLMVAHV